MTLLMARTSAEAHLYMDLHPCGCGETSRPQESAVIEAENDLASRYSGPCSSCGTYREFTFRLPEEVILPRPDTVVFGDGTPSELLDPGEWLWVADRYASASPWNTSELDPKGLRQVRRQVAAAEASMNEVLAFVPAEGDAVPPEAFRTEHGRAVHRAEPGRFYRDRLEVVRNTYREILGEIDATLAG